jgi:ABC-type glycerol-3-phosphate transport system substrate-binding protein
MKTNMLRLLALLLALLMVIPMVACADDTTDPNEDDPANIEDPTDDGDEEEEDDPYNVPDSIPEANFNGETFDILYYLDKFLVYFYAEERTGDLIDDAMFNAIAKTEERFGVDIVAYTPGSGSEMEYTNHVSTQITTGTVEFDMAQMHDVQGGNLSVQGFFVNALEIPYLDFSKPWWSQKAIDSLSYMDQLYLISSSMSYNSMGSTSVMFFNKDKLEDYGMEAPYQQVLDMDWYLEDLLEDLADIYEDTNGNGKDDQDFYGIVYPQEFYAWYESFGINLVEKSEDGMELIFNANDERAYTLLDLIYTSIYDVDGGFKGVRADMKNMFLQGQALYIPTSLSSAVQEFRNCEFKYGIVPYPMLDEEQGEYYAGYTERFMAVPYLCEDLEFVGTMIESMSAEGYRQVLPAYYETALKGRYTHDSESVQMLEIIREASVIDFAYVYGNDKCCSRGLYSRIKDQSRDYASYVEGLRSAGEARLEELAIVFGDMAD